MFFTASLVLTTFGSIQPPSLCPLKPFRRSLSPGKIESCIIMLK